MTKAADTNEKTKTPNSITMPGLNAWNRWLAVLHAAQGIIILLLSTMRVFPVQTTYLTLDPSASDIAGHPVLASATKHLFDVNLAYLVAAFFFLSAIAHATVAWWYRPRYEADLKRKINKVRWIEYSLSASVMMVAIAVLSGVADLSTLIAVFVLDAVMNLMGLAMELYNQGKAKPNWLVYNVGVLAGIVPWVIFALYVWGANIYGSGNIPTFVYWIYLSMFVLFSSFAANMYLQYKKVGKWSDYLYGERVYMILSLVAKSLLAWQVFAGTLRP
ncbi:MAG TPA: heliorhodopsin HeR [Candidatus Saccharimonadales bacterium]